MPQFLCPLAGLLGMVFSIVLGGIPPVARGGNLLSISLIRFSLLLHDFLLLYVASWDSY